MARVCRWLSRRETPEERAARLAHRRLRQLARQAGFEPVYNARVAQAVDSATALLLMQGWRPEAAHGEALRMVARRLPAPRLERRSLHRHRPSRSDDAAYRRGGGQ